MQHLIKLPLGTEKRQVCVWLDPHKARGLVRLNESGLLKWRLNLSDFGPWIKIFKHSCTILPNSALYVNYKLLMHCEVRHGRAALIICITHTSECDCVCHCGVLNDQCVLQLSDTVGLISHLCTIFNGWVKEETEASQSRAGLSPREPKSAPGHLLTCHPLRRTCSSLTASACSLMFTLSRFFIHAPNFAHLPS